MLFLFAVSILPVSVPLSAVGAVQQNSLKVSSLVDVVPADGLSHAVIVVSIVGQNNKPVVSSSFIEVYLSSSNPGVGAVPTNVTFPAASGYIVVNLTTTTTAGSTTISASAQGVNSGTSTVRTALLSGYPAAIAAYAAPNKDAAQPQSNGTIAIELVDNYGDPADASDGTTITLSSSNTQVLNVSSSTAFVAPGDALTNASYVTGLLTGSATVSLSSPGLKSASVTVTVVGSTPSELKVQSVSPVPPGSSGLTAAVWLVDQSGNPVVAATDITVSLTSSSFTLVNVQPTATIFAGTDYAEFTFSTGSIPPVNGMEVAQAQAIVTAAVTGLESSSFTITVQEPGEVGPGTAVGLDFFPPVLLANGGTYQGVYVYLRNASGFPVLAPATLSVALTSSDPSVLTVDNYATIYKGESYGLADAYVNFQVGITQITATAYCNCYNPATEELRTYGQAPASISVQPTPSVLPADGHAFDDLDVQLVSQANEPAVAPNNILLNLSSSNPSVAEVNESAYIPEGASSVLVPVETSSLPGEATITVVGSGLSTETPPSVTTVVPGASGTKLSFAPQPSLGLSSDGVGALQLVDSSGNPAIALSDVEVTITASNATILPAPLSLTVPAGSNFVTFPLQLHAAGTATFSATSQGLLSSSSQVDVIQAPYRAIISVSPSAPQQGGVVIVTAIVSLQGVPVSGASVRWASSTGTVSPQTEETGADGEAQASFTSQVAGATRISAEVTLEGGGVLTAAYVVTVASSSSLSFFSSEELPILGLGAAVVVVAVVDLVYLRRRRTRKKSILSDLKQSPS